MFSMWNENVAAGLPPLSAEAFRAISADAWALEPVQRDDRKWILRDEAAVLIDRLLVKVARASGAISVAMGECLDALCTGDGPMRLGYSSLGDYARENLNIAPRTADEYAQLARELRTRPILCAAVREGVVSRKKAEVILPVAVGDSEAEWVEKAKHETVRALKAAVAGGGAEPEKKKRFKRLVLELSPKDRAVVDEALELAGRELGATAPRSQRIEVICQEYLGAFPAPELPGPERKPEVLHGFEERPGTEARVWFEKEFERWSRLHKPEPVAAPEAQVDGYDRAKRIGARLKELAGMQRSWDELVGHLGYLIVSLGLWRDIGFADVGHYAAERLGMSARAFEQRVWLERRLWELPQLRQAMRDGKLGYEQARAIAPCAGLDGDLGDWIEKAQQMTVIELQRAVEAHRDAQMCAEKEIELRLPADVRALFSDACRAVRNAEQRWVPPSQCLVIIARHFIATWKRKQKSTARTRAMERDRWLCTVPGCSKGAGHSHHITPSAQGGSDEEWNRTGTCPPHHLRGIHMGYVRVRGKAPDQLVWELGEVD
jgi:hypothetical protein